MAGGDIQAGEGVEAHSSIYMGVFQNASLHHFMAAAVAFFTRLEHEFNLTACKVIFVVPSAAWRRPAAWRCGCRGRRCGPIWQPGWRKPRRSPHPWAGRPCPPAAEGFCQAFPLSRTATNAAAALLGLVPHFFQFLGDEGYRFGEIKAHFGLHVNLMAPGDDFGGEGFCLFQNSLHRYVPPLSNSYGEFPVNRKNRSRFPDDPLQLGPAGIPFYYKQRTAQLPRKRMGNLPKNGRKTK